MNVINVPKKSIDFLLPGCGSIEVALYNKLMEYKQSTEMLKEQFGVQVFFYQDYFINIRLLLMLYYVFLKFLLKMADMILKMFLQKFKFYFFVYNLIIE